MRDIINKGCSIPALSCNGLSNCMLVYGIFGDRTIDGCKNASLALTIGHRVTIMLHVHKGGFILLQVYLVYCNSS